METQVQIVERTCPVGFHWSNIVFLSTGLFIGSVGIGDTMLLFFCIIMGLNLACFVAITKMIMDGQIIDLNDDNEQCEEENDESNDSDENEERSDENEEQSDENEERNDENEERNDENAPLGTVNNPIIISDSEGDGSDIIDLSGEEIHKSKQE